MDKKTAAQVGICGFGTSRAVFSGSGVYDLHMERLPSGARAEPCPVPYEQTLVLLDGAMEYLSGGQSVPMSAGRLERGELVFLTVPPGAQYVLHNGGGQSARYFRLSFSTADRG